MRGVWLLLAVGLPAAALGVFLGWVLARGRARRFALGCFWAMAILGAIGLLLGGLAWLEGLPRDVVYVLLLLGGLCLGLGTGLLRVTRRRYAELARTPGKHGA